ncbi:MAG: cation transporter, partial [Pseudorhodoplanes sp.]
MTPADSPAKRNGGLLPLWLLLMFIWIAANSSLAPENLATGALISGALTFMSRRSEVWQSLRVSPHRLRHFLLYTGT